MAILVRQSTKIFGIFFKFSLPSHILSYIESLLLFAVGRGIGWSLGFAALARELRALPGVLLRQRRVRAPSVLLEGVLVTLYGRKSETYNTSTNPLFGDASKEPEKTRFVRFLF